MLLMRIQKRTWKKKGVIQYFCYIPNMIIEALQIQQGEEFMMYVNSTDEIILRRKKPYEVKDVDAFTSDILKGAETQ